MTKKQTKTKIKIQGKNHMVPVEVKDTIDFLSRIIRAHEVALLTWCHKIYNNKAVDKKDIDTLYDEMHKYIMRIPDAENILKEMEKVDKNNKVVKDESDAS